MASWWQIAKKALRIAARIVVASEPTPAPEASDKENPDRKAKIRPE